MDLVDEQDDVSAGPDLLQHLLETLLEISPVAGARYERTKIEGVQMLVGQRIRNVVDDNPLGETFDDRRLAHPWLSDEDGVVLRAPRQHLHDALDLVCPADHRVELALPSQLGEVPAELVEHG